MYPQRKLNLINMTCLYPEMSYIYLQELSFDKNKSNVHIVKMQDRAVYGTVKPCKTFLRFKYDMIKPAGQNFV